MKKQPLTQAAFSLFCFVFGFGSVGALAANCGPHQAILSDIGGLLQRLLLLGEHDGQALLLGVVTADAPAERAEVGVCLICRLVESDAETLIVAHAGRVGDSVGEGLVVACSLLHIRLDVLQEVDEGGAVGHLADREEVGIEERHLDLSTEG